MEPIFAVAGAVTEGVAVAAPAAVATGGGLAEVGAVTIGGATAGSVASVETGGAMVAESGFVTQVEALGDIPGASVEALPGVAKLLDLNASDAPGATGVTELPSVPNVTVETTSVEPELARVGELIRGYEDKLQQGGKLTDDEAVDLARNYVKQDELEQASKSGEAAAGESEATSEETPGTSAEAQQAEEKAEMSIVEAINKVNELMKLYKERMILEDAIQAVDRKTDKTNDDEIDRGRFVVRLAVVNSRIEVLESKLQIMDSGNPIVGAMIKNALMMGAMMRHAAATA